VLPALVRAHLSLLYSQFKEPKITKKIAPKKPVVQLEVVVNRAENMQFLLAVADGLISVHDLPTLQKRADKAPMKNVQQLCVNSQVYFCTQFSVFLFITAGYMTSFALPVLITVRRARGCLP